MRDRADLESLHRLAERHRTLLEAAAIAGCFHCLQVFPPSEIEEWIGMAADTALCPRCGIDSVLPQTPLVAIDTQLLSEMHEYWFQQ